MTSEQRLDRLERIAKLFVRAGLRARGNIKDQAEKINIIINNQIEHDERLAALNRSIERSHNELSQSQSELSQSQSELSRSQSELSRSLNELSQSQSGLSQSQNELSRSMNELAKAQVHANQRLDSLIDIVRRDRNGNSH